MKYSVYPNRFHTYFAIPAGLFIIILCYFACQLLDSGNRTLAIGYLAFSAVCLLTGKFLMETRKHHIVFSDMGITTVYASSGNPFCLSWEEIHFVCRSNGPKGHPCLLFSKTPLDCFQVRKLTQKAAWRSQLLVDDVVVLFLHQVRQPTELEKLVANYKKIKHM